MRTSLKPAVAAVALLAFPMVILAQGPQRAPFAGGGGAPFAAQAKMTCAQALKDVSKNDAGLSALAKPFNASAAKLKKSPKDAKVKKVYVDAAIKYEQAIYLGPSKLSPPIKYRAALALCRLVLAVEPKNAQAKADEDQMVGIYKQMGRPVPQ